MSYDILAFDPALVDDEGFDAWWSPQQLQHDDAPSSPLIDEFARRLQRTFPSLHEDGAWEAAEQAGDEDRKNHLAEYFFGCGFVYVNFSWSLVKEARSTFLRVAQESGVAVALVSDGPTILRPVPHGDPGEGGGVLLVEDFADIPYRSAAQPAPAIAAVLPQRLHQLNGDDYGVYILEVEPSSTGRPRRSGSSSGEYIQSAGSAGSMVVEVKRLEADGVLRQYAIGRPLDAAGETEVFWARRECSTTVPSPEVFTADQALPIYRRWCEQGTVSEEYRLRLLDI